MILGVAVRPGLRIMVASKPVDFRKGSKRRGADLWRLGAWS